MSDKEIIDRARKVFAYCMDIESENYTLFREDLKFANADSDNGWQWSESESRERNSSDKPALTINKVKVHNRQIANELRQNEPSIDVRPVDSFADVKTAEVFNGAIRHIQEISSFNQIVNRTMDYVIDGGLGYWRVVTDYESDSSFNQEAYIKGIDNPMNCYLYGYTRIDGSDATDGFVFEDMKKSEFERKHGKDAAKNITWEGNDSWLNEDEIRVCEHFYTKVTSDTLYANEAGDSVLLSELETDEERDLVKSNPLLRKRKVEVKSIKWCTIAGDKIIDKKDWPGKYIPIVRVIGEEVVIDGKVHRKGNTRALKDPQKMYNYWTSSAVEFVALQGKTPWDAPAEAIQGYEDVWSSANTNNHSILPWNHLDEQGNAVPRPQKTPAPVMAQAYMQGMEIASNEIQAASGQFDAQLGQNVNQQSGRALTAVQRKGDNATYHYTANRDIAVKFTGKILVDLIPKIYDTARIIRVLGEDSKEDKAQIDPEQEQAYLEKRNEITGSIKKIYNPGVGNYDVVVKSGANYGTKRQESFEALTEIAARNPQLMQIAGDLIMRSSDVTGADKIADRLAKTLPPELQDHDEEDDEGRQAQQMQAAMQQHEQQLAEQEQMIKAMDETIEKMTAELESKENDAKKLDIDKYNAETNRMKAKPQQPEELPMTELEYRKAEAETKKVEAEARKSEIEAAKLAKELQEENDDMENSKQILAALEMMTQGIVSLQDGMKMACAPRRSEIEFDESGMPISSISRPILHNTNEQMGH